MCVCVSLDEREDMCRYGVRVHRCWNGRSSWIRVLCGFIEWSVVEAQNLNIEAVNTASKSAAKKNCSAL